MGRKVVQGQLFEGTSWHDYTSKNHLYAVTGQDPVAYSEAMLKLKEVNYGPDFVSYTSRYGVEYVEHERYQWPVESYANRNYALVGATFLDGTSIGTAAKAGVNRSRFYMDFSENPFRHSQVITGPTVNLSRVLIKTDGVQIGNAWRYEVEMANSKGPDDFISGKELQPNTRWAGIYGLSPSERSYEGFGISFQTDGGMAAEMSSFRLEHTIPGNLVYEMTKPLAFYVKNKHTGKTEMSWVSNIEMGLEREAQRTANMLIMHGQSNLWADGTRGNYDKNGSTINAGSGFKEQWSLATMHTWNLEPDIEYMTEIALDAFVGRIDSSNRKCIVSGGEWGFRAWSKAVNKYLGENAIQMLMNDTTGKQFSWNGNLVAAKAGQFHAVATINGIEFTYMLDPYKDNLDFNTKQHPLGGPVSSYEFDIMGFGGYDDKSNLKITRLKGQKGQDVFSVVPGIRSPWGNRGAGSGFSSASLAAGPVDASTIHLANFGIGAKTLNPNLIIQYHPEQSYMY